MRAWAIGSFASDLGVVEKPMAVGVPKVLRHQVSNFGADGRPPD